MMLTALNPKHNDWYEELCALAAIGELSSSEFEEFRAHLAECEPCRELHADFRRIAADDLGRVAVSKKSETTAEGANAADPHALLGRVLSRAAGQRPTLVTPAEPASIRRKNVLFARPLRRVFVWLRQPALSYGTVGLLLCAVVAVGAYRFREAQLSPAIAKLQSEFNDLKNREKAKTAEQERTSESLARSEADREALRKSLEAAQGRLAQLQNEQKLLESALIVERAQLGQQGQELQAARAAEDNRTKEVASLEIRLRDAVGRTEQQRRIAENLEAKLESAEQQTPNIPEVQGFGDAEAKELFGARDLHIVDVYDVDTKGATKRTYGRVYYVEKKLLMFYAFDLDTKRRNRAPASFQAWGYRQPNASNPESLGLLSMDDPSLNRWVLKVNNRSVLQRIDAVFVTAETPSGSSSPTGRHLLYANLGGPANHP